MPIMHHTSQSIDTGLGCCFCFAVLCFLCLLSALVEMIVLNSLPFLQLPLEYSYGLLCLGKSTKVVQFQLWYACYCYTIYVKLSGGSQAAVAYT